MTYATIEGFEKLTAQEVFDISAKHLLKQNERSLFARWRADAGVCAYRGSDGLQCAAGPFLADDRARECEESDWCTLVDSGTVPDTNYDLISELQGIHDCIDPSAWRKELAVLAEKRGLNTEALS